MKTENFKSITLFILGFGLFMFTRYCRFLPSIDGVVLVAPIFILRFIRTQPKLRGILLTLLGFLLAFNISLWGLFELDSASMTKYYNIIRSSMLAIVWFIPFMFDRLLYSKFKDHKILATLTFPVIITALFFLLTYDGPFDDGSGTTSTFGYSYGSLSFMQVRSLFGIWILIFVHSWLYAVVNYFWENNFRWDKIKKLAFIYPSVLILIFLFGFIRKSIHSTTGTNTVKVATMVLVPENGKPVLMSKVFESHETSPFNETVSRIENMVSEAGRNGAKIVSSQEFSILVSEKDVPKLKNKLQRIAKENNVYLSIAFAYFAEKGKGENKHLLIDPAGNIQLDYAKRYLLGFGPYGEPGIFKKGKEVIQYLDTPHGRIGLSTCRDAGFPKFMRQAAQANVDIMLSPSYDWPASHTAWYTNATVENGFSFVRPTYNGYSYAADFYAAEITHMESYKSETGIMYADVPVKGVKTLYGQIGDVFGWVCLLGFIGLLFPARKLKPKKVKS